MPKAKKFYDADISKSKKLIESLQLSTNDYGANSQKIVLNLFK